MSFLVPVLPSCKGNPSLRNGYINLSNLRLNLEMVRMIISKLEA